MKRKARFIYICRGVNVFDSEGGKCARRGEGGKRVRIFLFIYSSGGGFLDSVEKIALPLLLLLLLLGSGAN